MSGKIIVIQGDEGIHRQLEVTLKSHGYEVMGFDNTQDALCKMKIYIPDLVIMDTAIDGDDGIKAIKAMRQTDVFRSIPVIILTSKDSELDKIEGLDSGANDYMTKPFSVFELCARIRVQLRGINEPTATFNGVPVYEYGELRLDLIAHVVSVSGNAVELTFKEFELLRSLMENKDRVLTREHLLTQIWGDTHQDDSRTLDMHIGTLRQKINDTASKSRYIKTVRSVGYKFIGNR